MKTELKANELRIGNYVKSNNPIYRKDEFGKYLNILAINDDSVTVTVIEDNELKGYTFGQLYEYIEPIQITEEILLKCGFECYEFDNGQPNQYRFKSRLIVIRDNIFVDYGSDVKIYSLHQLQNLYFALTNEELPINL